MHLFSANSAKALRRGIRGEDYFAGALANRQLPTGKKGSLSNSSSDYGLDESYNSADELSDTASLHQSDGYGSSTLVRPCTLNTQSQYIEETHNTYSSQYAHSQYIATHQMIKENSQSQYNGQSILYARVQKGSAAHQHQSSPDPWVGTQTQVPQSKLGVGPPSSLAEQLKQVLAEREKRMGSDSTNNSTDDLSEKNKTAQHLLEEIRQAVSEANARG